MMLDLTQNQVEILFDLVRRACPDTMRDTEECRALYELDDLLEAKLGYGGGGSGS